VVLISSLAVFSSIYDDSNFSVEQKGSAASLNANVEPASFLK